VSRPVALRGVIEGFYGPPWSHDARLAVIEFVAERGMNAYVYAPKSDPRHRGAWRDPYEPDEMARLAALAARCRDVGGRFGFALSPGLDIAYGDDADRAALLAKLRPLLDEGVDWVVLALDDIPNRPGLAAEQAALTGWLAERVDARLSLVPTEYVGTRPSPYLAELATGLPGAVDVMWTGPTVCSPCIDAGDARGWRDALGDRPLVLWDNYPVNDAVMENELHLGPYRGRTRALTDELDGVLCNPMLQPHASKVALATAAEFLRDPDAYDEAAAWRRAIHEVGGPRAGPLGALARACADGPLLQARHLLLHELVDELEHAVKGAAWPVAVSMLHEELEELRAAEGAYADAADDPLASELAPWLEQARREAHAGLAALRLVQQTRPVASRAPAGEGRAAAPDAEAAMIHAFALLFAWTDARRGERVVAGPRFAVHPAVVQRADGTPGLDVDLALRDDQSAIDRLCRVALAEYGAWERDEEPAPLTARVGMERLPVDPDGSFSAPAADTVVVQAGEHATRVGADDRPPFPDARLS
jgi:hyaluronoglucosaminidase